MEEKNILDSLSAQEEDTSSKLNNEKKPETGLPEERDLAISPKIFPGEANRMSKKPAFPRQQLRDGFSDR